MEKTIEKYSSEGITIEYSLVGKGEPILIFHGGHSNCNEEFGYKSLLDNGYSIITPSRAGYGSTSKEAGESLTKACGHYDNLLKHLKIDQVHVIAISAGGPTGIRFASLYSEKVKSLILECAVSKEWLTSKDIEYKAAHFIFRPSIEGVTWKMLSTLSHLFPNTIFKMMAPQFSSLNKKELQLKSEVSDVVEFTKMNARQRSGHGFLIDLKQSKEIKDQDLKSISSPTLIIHSENDGFISLEHPQNAHEKIAKSELYVVDTWGHLIWIGKSAKKINQKLISFLKSV
ncbi:alpha/beta fold hydrolase [Psychrobacillus psychrodurans]|uniref:alpha/beta fold hydrolase n=1 Tax=Psychrobacillus psychrodurans TaxID=126157 RepID=UPI0008E6106D|nr:alpha/beta hydrolase [Psychrobacillus psychrodurans]MCZ8541877.1 alpha/beta hydrolase [Psychrobacillus psychrodurans]SFN11284.1 Pimeloyl-ACP methyl ester carboxylesterase [Psychrobacillus psychrodurans]